MKMSSVEKIPTELLCDIFQYIEGKELRKNPLLVCKKWGQVIQFSHSILPLPLTNYDYNVDIDSCDDMASINLSDRRNTWDKSVRRPTIEEAVKNFWNELYILSHVSLTASKAVYILLKMLAVKSGCAVKVCGIFRQE
jgi:hypothetical protein